MTRPWKDRLLVLALRVGGVASLLSLPTVFLPNPWMEATHARLGLGPLAVTPVFEYLARSVSFFYAFYGGLLILASCDVRRLAPLVTYLAAGTLALGASAVAIDLHAGLPWWWVAGEGVATAPFGAALFLLRPGADTAQEKNP